MAVYKATQNYAQRSSNDDKSSSASLSESKRHPGDLKVLGSLGGRERRSISYSVASVKIFEYKWFRYLKDGLPCKDS